MTTTYNFARQLAIGGAHERRLDAHFALWFAITPATRDEQRAGIDRIFVHRATGKRYTVEYKADDKAGRTGNAFIEVTSVDTAGRAGWAMSSQADILVYLVVEPETVYALRMPTLRLALALWQRHYPKRSAQNQGYKTWGYLVPLAELEKIALEVH